jgi:hypothetical protein
MRFKLLLAFCIILMSIANTTSAITFSGENVPLDSSFHLGLVDGPGLGVSIGGEIFYLQGAFGIGGDIEQQITNSAYEQNISILKYGLALKYIINDDFFVTLHFGVGSTNLLSQSVEYMDTFSGDRKTIDEGTRVKASYWAIAPNFRIGEYYLSPKVVFNRIETGGTLLEVDVNIGHKF